MKKLRKRSGAAHRYFAKRFLQNDITLYQFSLSISRTAPAGVGTGRPGRHVFLNEKPQKIDPVTGVFLDEKPQKIDPVTGVFLNEIL